MAKKRARIFRGVLGVAAGLTAGAGAYYLGKQAGIDEVHAAAAAESASATASTKSIDVASQSPLEDTPRPIMQVPAEEVAHVARDRQAYHSLISDRARDLRSRIAEQAYATVLADGNVNANGQVQAEGVEVVGDEPSEQAAQEGSETPMVSEPYERIQDALKTSKLFSTEGEDAYKPTPFTMPKS